MRDLEGALGPEVITFVEQHVNSLLTWDLIVFFHQNPGEVLDVDTLAVRLGRSPAEIAPEIDALCAGGVLQTAGGLVRYRPDSPHAHTIDAFIGACKNRSHRLALIALVLQKISPHFKR